ncbi:bifunctional 2-C-methyl-D-erythritol 4-phosphate cytidylyltransferase/2-C-methyl-D-erythritol 2,4-cyclodiphosphate synthase [Pararhodobacter oceanensis]|uniref:Bifunctional enzyme IspD/IspF n=1 Tax=Pararhodobacter oceanensis TaxID=2172121 RepID=A0A2T8HTG9_9RHOB|nr:bifunctional 2-C-methyl-D-erythritol 4-phosphate cytidylyltransferase/2-C-methyl-D-erythritol 2,4-cyclodiphosphate synthase [Pararhodobacter oceanensis]PVH28754.1 bifunctional 2-C-methyl-D-erythritol 4-phosphate cytidylyltransferase/2-C-methyl-D-erythritol 2,4-cyclodiphosphate synthase [Pararhodobacter oceanensis]
MRNAENTAVVIVAAGRGSRMGGGMPKQWRQLAGKPVIAHTVAAFQDAGFARICLVIHPEDAGLAAGLPVSLVHGGATRSDSVRAALEHLAQDPPARVLIHDAARPLVPRAVIAEVMEALDTQSAAAPALPVTDALWRGGDGVVMGTQARDGLFRAQTPQGFRFAAILSAHRALKHDAADDVEVIRAAGEEVWITQGSDENLKLTYPIDFTRAERILSERQTIKGQTFSGQALEGSKMDIRLGNGFDVHAFTEGDHLWLCGHKIAHERGLLGHSDADVGMHALTDAIYGALAQGDIGRHFPPSDPQWKGAASHIFLRHAVELAAEMGYRIANIDVTLICERPKITPHADAMRAALGEIMGLEIERISVKASTSERLGFTGREEGIAAITSATLVKP